MAIRKFEVTHEALVEQGGTAPYVAYCLENGHMGSGDSEDEAIERLRQNVMLDIRIQRKLRLAKMMGSADGQAEKV